MDRIELKNMRFFGYHGVFDEEKKLGQRFEADVTLYASLRKAGLTDQLHESIDYSEVYSIINRIITGTPRQLLESVAEEIAGQLLLSFSRINEVHVTLRKPEAPIPGLFDYVAVHIERKREEPAF